MTSDHILAPQSGQLPHATSATSAPFWRGCAEGVLRYQRCQACDEANFPPSEHCRNCLSDKLSWAVSEGEGEIYSWTVVHRPVTPEFQAPYAPAIVTLREGYQMLTNVVGVHIDDLKVGMPVRVEFHAVDGDFTLPYFTAAKA